MSGRHAAPDKRGFYRDLSTMLGGILTVGLVVFGLLWAYSSWRDGRNAASTTSAALAVVTTTSPTTSTTASLSTTSTTTDRTTSTALVLRAPDEVRVLVLNAVGVAGLAAVVTERLDGLGYQTVTPSNYQPTLEQSRVWYHAGFAPEAFELAGAVAPDALIEENPDLTSEADIVVVLGASYEG